VALMIEVDQLVKRFGAVTAVDGLTFAVRPGHVTGFLGPNGAGKTTTMRLILGLDAPTSSAPCWTPPPCTRGGPPRRTWPRSRRATASGAAASPRCSS
jgi:ABC-2 type transport system ATP-binding protein